MSITGSPDAPPFASVSRSPTSSSGMFAAQGISAGALRARTHGPRAACGHRHARFGRCAAHLSGGHLLRHRYAACAPRQPTPDDRAVRDIRGRRRRLRPRRRQRRTVAKFCEVAALDEDEQFATNRQRVTGYDDAAAESLAAAARTPAQLLDRASQSRWCAVRLGARVSTRCSRTRRLRRAKWSCRMSHPTAGDIRVLGSPLRLSDTPASQRTAPPTLGQHTEAVLRHDLGLTVDAVNALRTTGVI